MKRMLRTRIRTATASGARPVKRFTRSAGSKFFISMSSVFALSGIPCWYWALALAITAYQAYRGFRFQWLLGIDSPRRIAEEAAAAQQAQVYDATGNVIETYTSTR